MIELTDEMRVRLVNAVTEGFPVMGASVDKRGQPKLSFYGSFHVHSKDQVAIWVRNPESGVLTRIQDNPRMAFVYRNQQERIYWQFQGRARRVDEPEERDRVYEESAEIERMLDTEHKGVAVVVDLDDVTGRGLKMTREDSPK